MNLLSKNAPLETSIERMRSVLAAAGCEMTFSQEKHPLEHCYSVNLASVEAPKHIYSNGKGVCSEASMASALGEYIERLQTNNFFVDFHLPQRNYYPDAVAFEFGGEYLNSELRAVYDPHGELDDEDLVDFNSDHDDKIVALPFVKRSSDEVVYIPLNILSNLYASNGLATGNTPLEAQVQALSEIFERHAKIEIIKNGYALPSYPEEVVALFPKVQRDVAALREAGYVVEVLDASLGGKFPVTAISLINPENGTLFVSFGAHPILEVSLERTMTELMQGRTLEELDAFETPTFDMSLIEDSFNLESHFIDSNGRLGFGFLSRVKSFEYAPWSYEGEGSADEYAYLEAIVRSMDAEVYLREYDYLGFYSCQMVVPGVSEVYPVEDLVYNNKNGGKFIRDIVLNFEQYDPDEVLDAVDSFEETLNVEKFIGVIFEHNFTMAAFKAQAYLRLGAYDEALPLLEFDADKTGRVVAELIRMDEAGLLFEDYEEGLCHIYTRERVQKAVEILEGSASLVDVSLHEDYRRMLEMFDRLEVKKEAIA